MSLNRVSYPLKYITIDHSRHLTISFIVATIWYFEEENIARFAIFIDPTPCSKNHDTQWYIRLFVRLEASNLEKRNTMESVMEISKGKNRIIERFARGEKERESVERMERQCVASGRVSKASTGRKSCRVAMESIRPRFLGQSSLVIRSVAKLL